MSDMNRRLKKIEKALKVGREQRRDVEIVVFGGDLPADRTEGNMTIRHVLYDQKAKQWGSKAG